MEPVTIVKKVMMPKDVQVTVWNTIDGQLFDTPEKAQKHEEAYLAKEEFFKIAREVTALNSLPSVELGSEFFMFNLKTEKELDIVNNFLKTNFELDEQSILMSHLRQKVVMIIIKSVVDGKYIATFHIIGDIVEDLNKCLQILTNL